VADQVTLDGIELTRIGLGTNRLRNTPDNRRLLEEAIEAGVNFIDTAHVYTDGESEQTIGDALAPFPEDCVVGTKGGMGDGRPDKLRADIEESLRRLQTDTIALYYLHRPDPEVPIETIVETIEEYRQQGAIRHVGLSNVNVEQIELARRVASIEAVQNHYSRTERASDDVVDYCAEQQIIFVPYFPLRGEEGPELTEIAREHDATPSQVALAWLLRRSPAMLPIPGTTSPEHLRENLGALDIELSDEEYEALASR
jgi:pyridoxine 4-dehydrogenase